MTGYSHVLSDFFRVVCLTLYCLKNIVFICLSKLRTALVFSMRAVFLPYRLASQASLLGKG